MPITTLPSRRSVVGFAIAATLLGGASPLAAQARERTLFVSVLDDKGVPVPEVATTDLAVREDGAAREILRITPATEPLQVALLVDNSTAAQPEIANMRKALAAFVRAFRPGDEVSLVTLADRPTLAVDATTDTAQLQKGVDRIFSQPGSGTYFLDALVEVSQGFRKREATRPVIVSFTTEGTEFSNRNYDQVLEAIASSGAALHAFVLTDPGGTDLTSTEARSRAIVLDRGTRETGGVRHDLLTTLALEDALAAKARELTNQVKVIYARPESIIPPQRVTVEATRPGLTARGQLVRIKER
jgi:VWFA-related protein